MRDMKGLLKSGLSSFNFWKAASFWLICLLYVLFQGGKTSVMVFAMATLLVIYWMMGGLGGIKRVKGERSLSLEGERTGLLKAGSQVQVRLQVKTPRFIPLPFIVVREHLQRHNGDSWIFEDSIVPRFNQETVLEYQTPPLERGKYVFSGTDCYAEDIFGLMEHKGSFQSGGEFRILPRTVFIPHWQLQSRNSRSAGPETAVSVSRRETTQINGVRDYIYGDRLSRIHWNATAKTGTWKSKEFEHESLPKTVIVLDAHSISYVQPSQFEVAVSVAASLLEYGARERISMGLCTLGKTCHAFAPTESYLDRMQMLHHLVDINADGYGAYKNKLESKRDCFPPGAFFILISPLTDQNMLEMMRFAKSRQMTLYHIHIGFQGQQAYRRGPWRAALREHGMKGISVDSLRELPAALGGGGGA